MPARQLILNFNLKIKNSLQGKGFTLVELMIAVSIVAIISSVGLVYFGQSQKLARDAKRKQDLQAITVALELYHQKNKHYPCTTGFISSGTTQSDWITNDTSVAGCSTGGNLDSQYIKPAVPIDPSNQSAGSAPYTGDTTLGYGYYSTTGCGDTYVVFAGLENTNDKDTIAKRNAAGNPYKWCSGVALNSSNGWGANKFLLYNW